MKFVVRAFVVALVVTVFSQGAFAQLGGQNMEERRAMFRQKMQERVKAIDTNGDGVIDREEYMANAEQRFSKLDANGDGKLTSGEIKAAREM